jgi:hypothetical protein
MSETKWRPEGWKNPYLTIQEARELYGGLPFKYNPEERVAFEAGADAMLEAIKKQPRVKYLKCSIPNPAYPYPGAYYYIPDDKEK